MSHKATEPQATYNGQEAYAFLKSLNIKIGRAKVYKDISVGNLPCTLDKRVRHDDLLAYAESLKAPEPNTCSPLEESRAACRALTNLLQDVLPHTVPSTSLRAKLERWKEQAESFPNIRLQAVQTAIDKVLCTAAKPAPSPTRKQNNETLLLGIALGLLAKGKVYKKDTLFLARWIRNHPTIKEHQGIKRILLASDKLNIVHEDDADTQLQQVQKALNDYIKSYGLQVPNIKIKGEKWRGANNPSVAIPNDHEIFDKIEEMDFSAAFCFTGLFAFGTREQCENTVMQLGASVKKRNLTQNEKGYLIVGTASNPQWRGIRGGTKIDEAIYFKQMGKDINIVCEDDWVEFVMKEQRSRGIIPPTEIPTGQFSPPWPIHSIYFVIPPQDIAEIRTVLAADSIAITDSYCDETDAVIMPSGLCQASEDELMCLPNIGPAKAGRITAARDSGALVVSEEEFRAWVWWENEYKTKQIPS